jgi:LmbE family N-acetylglucosaminyl deacetylase
MDWKQERDALLAQTHAFVQSVTAKIAEAPKSDPQKSEARLPAVTPYPPPVRAEPEPAATCLEATPNEPVRALEPPAPFGPPPLTDLHSDEQDEIRARIASFRAHQERFNRERAEYFSATIARLRAALHAVPPRGRQGEARAPVSPRSSPGPAANIPETRSGSRSSENAQGPS